MTQLDRLKIRTGEKDEPLLRLLLDEARNYILSYTRRPEDKWLTHFDSIQLKIAVIEYNRLGVEGFSSRSEGGISTSFGSGAEDYPESITKTLNPYRLIGVI